MAELSRIDISNDFNTPEVLRYSELSTADTPIVETPSAMRELPFFEVTERKKEKSRSETAWLDGLRGCAALAVVFGHWSGFAEFDGGPVFGAHSLNDSNPVRFNEWYRLPSFRWLYASADAAVSVFFIISGYVLTRKSLSYIRQRDYERFTASLSSTVLRRVLRLWLPTIFAAFTGMLLSVMGFRNRYQGMYPLSSNITFLAELLLWFKESIMFLNPFIYFQKDVHASRWEATLWTIPIEYAGSGFCFLMMLALARVHNAAIRRTILFSSAVGGVLYEQIWWMTLFSIGIMFADFSLNNSSSSSKKASLWRNIALHSTLLLAFWLIQVPREPSFYYFVTIPGYAFLYKIVPSSIMGRFWSSVGSVLLFVCSENLIWLHRMLESQFCQFLGRISFSLYLIHFQYNDLVYWGALAPFIASLAGRSGALGPYIHFICYFGIMLPSVFLLASWHEHWIDHGAIQFARWFERCSTRA